MYTAWRSSWRLPSEALEGRTAEALAGFEAARRRWEELGLKLHLAQNRVHLALLCPGTPEAAAAAEEARRLAGADGGDQPCSPCWSARPGRPAPRRPAAPGHLRAARAPARYPPRHAPAGLLRGRAGQPGGRTGAPAHREGPRPPASTPTWPRPSPTPPPTCWCSATAWATRSWPTRTAAPLAAPATGDAGRRLPHHHHGEPGHGGHRPAARRPRPDRLPVLAARAGQVANTIKWTTLWGDPLDLDFDAFLPRPNTWERLPPPGGSRSSLQPLNFGRHTAHPGPLPGLPARGLRRRRGGGGRRPCR